MQWVLVCVLLAGSATAVSGARILSVLPMTARSHHSIFHGVLRALAKRGHEVVNYSPYPLEEPLPNYRDVLLDGSDFSPHNMTKDHLLDLMNWSPLVSSHIIWNKVKQMGYNAMKSEQMKQLLESDEKFDIIILEAFFAQEVLLGLGHRFKALVVAVHPFTSYCLVNRAAGNALSLAFIPDFSLPYSDQMTLYERGLNAYSILRTLHLYYTEFLPEQEEWMRKFFNDPTMPPVEDMIHNISLYFINAHPNIHFTQPYTPNLIPIGGIHVSAEHKPLPKAIQKFMDEADQGVIYFSLGSIVPDNVLGQEFFDNFIKVFRRLPQRVLWKMRSNMTNLPENVMTVYWAPQQALLAHPNTVVFMTHGGLFSQHEAINYGVPVVCIPFFGDQPINARFYEDQGIGVKLPFRTLSEETIYSALNTILSDSKYKKNMTRLSRLYRDQPMSPSDTAVFWVEYILRHRGAPHLRPAASHLRWYQLMLLDVVAALLAVAAAMLVTLWLVLRYLLHLVFSTHKRTSIVKKNS